MQLPAAPGEESVAVVTVVIFGPRHALRIFRCALVSQRQQSGFETNTSELEGSCSLGVACRLAGRFNQQQGDVMSYVNFVLAIALTTLLGCGTMPGADGLSESTSRARGVQMMVLEDDELWASRSHLLSSIDNRMPQLRIVRGAGCPQLQLRGRRSFTDNGSDPTIYIDGTRAVNTCVLEQISASEAQRVEIYPMGVTSRPGYRNSPGGLILIFTRRGDL